MHGNRSNSNQSECRIYRVNQSIGLNITQPLVNRVDQHLKIQFEPVQP